MTNQSTAGVILGTAFHSAGTGPMVETDVSGRSIEITFESEEIVTEFGPQVVHHISGLGRPAVAIFRHGIPHALLPNQINYRAQAAALKRLDVRSLLITSSVGVLDPNVPLFQPLLPGDLLMPDNRLPDGSACSMFVDSNPDQGHLVIEEGLFSQTLTDVLNDCCLHNGAQPMRDLVFAYVGGPRTKTPAENRMWAQLGAAINSMTLAPELVLANELEIACTALCVGHKYSLHANPPDLDLAESLNRSRREQIHIILDFLRAAPLVPFANRIYRFE